MSESLADLAARMRDCRVCEAHLPLGPRPVFRLSATARLLIIGQAPGTKVHETGVPWNDRSGDRLRLWLDLDRDTFYDASRIAILPTGLCYPGRLPRGGDCPPRPECAPLWHGLVLDHLPDVALVLLVGSYAQAFHLGERRKATLTETVAAWRDYLPRFLVLPHPSWRTTAWEAKTPWFGAELLPEARRRVKDALG
ncbi:putative uracil-DNA glycosylase(Uracil-DNA glycosylase-like,4-195) [Magnetospirillum sp. XM-1]|uniref:uracil-DNA glycosylase family protein n=1 Tax=Magnetospirillum sp. XM-1 TaxID=1663591 RepID=UPI00073DE487|nr:uracil-DNA glycosylase family protein [Magnetospirillum sp. XM-1]CUW38868.1 putative uracil-DNA glycosylase(Uracil-DNA glycosylase-like,4-195) [Magnetospirillum sp. XM-1]